MLHSNKDFPKDETSDAILTPSTAEPFSNLTRIIRHQLPIIMVTMSLTIALGILYLVTTPPTYLAIASVVIDARKAESFEQKQPVRSDNATDAGAVDTQIQILKSASIARLVVNKLRLTSDPEFVDPANDLKGAFVKLISGLFHTAKPDPARTAVKVLDSKCTITRVGQSYVIEIGVESLDPNKAARIANAIADAYLDDQLETKYAAARRASVWLKERANELRAEASAAQRAVVEFKAKNNIVSAGEGRLMNDQQLTEVNTQLVLSKAATGEAKARYERIREIMKQDLPDASVAEALKSEVIIKLRGQYLDLASREAILSQRYGPNHLATVNVRSEKREILNSIRDEMQKIEEGAKSDYEIAQARELSIKESLGQAVSKSQIANEAQIQLRELESAAQTAQELYDNFLERYMQAVQQQSFPITEARLVDPAEPPTSKNHPKKFLILLLTGATGFVVSFCAASLRESSDRVFRSSAQVQDHLLVKCLAVLPNVRTAASSSVPTQRATAAILTAPAVLGRTQSMLSYTLDEPFSQFTEALRSIKVASDLKGSAEALKVIGLTSTLPNEGKTVVAANYAHVIAKGGGSTILIDADLRNPTLSRQLARPGGLGLVDIIAGGTTIDDVIVGDSRTGLTFLPSGSTAKILHTHDLLSSDAMKKLIGQLRRRYECLIIDLPPLIPIVDARATANFVDAYIYLVEWGRTRIDTAKHSLSNAPELHKRLLGVVLNKVDMTKLKRYERYLSNYYYDEYSGQYMGSKPPFE